MKPNRPRAAFAFTALLLLHDPIITLAGSALLSHALLVFGMLWFCMVAVSRVLVSCRLPWVGGLPTFATVCSLAGLGVIYSLIDQGSLNVQLQFLATFVLLPVMWLAFSELAEHSDLRSSLGRLLLVYVATELAIMMLQLAYFLIGVGIPPGDIYESMVPGSQFNGNNLAAIIVLLSIFYNASSHDARGRERLLFNLIVVAILLITASRLAILLYLADRIRCMGLHKMGRLLATVVILVVCAVGVTSIEYTGNETIDASLYKAKSLATVVQVGMEADSSTSSRAASYFNFIDQLGRLGTGSAAILNYSNFTVDAVFEDKALYVNPHSLIAEFGYWMGWPGLLVLGVFLLITYMRPSQGSLGQRGFVLMAILLTTSIPSSAIPLPPLWVGLLLLAMLGAFGPTYRAGTQARRLPL
ncbi:hypothetical protein NVV93_06520 [Pseudomonas sp. LS44]|uniref:O-antigen ligase family protein n=1 Tax=Pseudomonas sp. LS44 TaxID=1357074 RepID=UPI00215A1E16|nr:O-antigen ligase family protein [Pseudomonas sp. LS44]UVE19036.1 hypothetical protein NVV93_06520 [Pseudomonas sp. LS44]